MYSKQTYLQSIPSVNKGKHACQRVFPSLFVLFALAGARPPASQKPKIARISIAGRCGQFCRSRNASRQGKARREYCRIVKGLDAVWAYFCPSKPCLPLSTDGRFAEEHCVQAEYIKSNFATFIKPEKVNKVLNRKLHNSWWFGFQHSLAFLGVASIVAFYYHIRTIYIGSSYTFGQAVNCVSDPQN